MALHVAIYPIFYILLTIVTLLLILITPLSLIFHLPKPASSPEFLTPLILLCAAYVLVLAVSLALYSARMWKVRRQIARIPRRLEKVGTADRERREGALANSALVAFVARPQADQEVGGRDLVIKEIAAQMKDPERLKELGVVYDKMRWGRGGGEGDEELWVALLGGASRILAEQSESSSLNTGGGNSTVSFQHY